VYSNSNEKGLFVVAENFNIKDFLEKDKVEISSYLDYNPKYRGVSGGAKYVYGLILKRYSLTQAKFNQAIEEDKLEDFSFLDEKNDLFCYFSNDSICFYMGVSEKTVIKYKKELVDVGLLDDKQQGHNKNNRLYVKKPEMSLEIKKKFDNDLKEYLSAQKEERKKKNSKRKDNKNKKKEAVTPIVPSELKKGKFTQDEGELKKGKFSELEKGKFVNCNNYGQSTNESFSTDESFSTNEFNNQSINLEEDKYKDIVDELNSMYGKEEYPTIILSTINRFKDRLIDDGITPIEIMSFYNSKEHELGLHDFTTKLNDVLKKTKGKIGSFSAVMKMACDKFVLDNYDKLYPEELEQATTFENFDGTKIGSMFKNYVEGTKLYEEYDEEVY
jgi:hypothetical protein